MWVQLCEDFINGTVLDDGFVSAEEASRLPPPSLWWLWMCSFHSRVAHYICGLRRCRFMELSWHEMVAVGCRQSKDGLVYLLKNSWVDPWQWLLVHEDYLVKLSASFRFLDITQIFRI